MKLTAWKPSLLALFVCAGLAACADRADEARTETGQITTPVTDTAVAPGQTTTTDPYATTPMDSTDPMATTSDISGASGTASTTDTMGNTTGDMSSTTGDAADRCAGLAGQALTECLEVEATREQPMDNQSVDPTELPDR